MIKLSVVIPVYNEEKTVAEIVKQVFDVEIPGVSLEVIIVNDASTDNTTIALRALARKYAHLVVVTHKENQGKGSAVRTGFAKAKGDYIVIQDADLEYDPQYFKSLLQPIIDKKTQVVYGTRLKNLPKKHGSMSRFRFLIHFFGNRFLSLTTSLLYGQWITDMETCYKIFPREFLKNVNLTGQGFEFEPEITSKLIKAGYKIVEVPIMTNPRGTKEGKKLHTIRDGAHALLTLIKYRFVN